jgi:hypothetical protein
LALRGRALYPRKSCDFLGTPVSFLRRKVYGENYAFGIVDVNDRPRWDLATAMHEANLELNRMRNEAKTSVAAK